MRRFIVYGANTPLGRRVVWNLTNYAQFRDIKVSVRDVNAIPNDMTDIQDDFWTDMVGEAGVGRADAIVNCHRIDPEIAETDPKLAWTAHALRPAGLALAARAANIPMIHISTDRVFGGDHPSPDTSYEKKPNTVFGVSMAEGERVIQAFHPTTDEGIGAVIIRHSTLYGFDIDANPVVGSTCKDSPSFIGEVGFLIARNLIENDSSLHREGGVIHCAPPDEPRSMYSILTELGDGKVNMKEENVTYGLTPTPGWFLPSGWSKSWNDSQRETEVRGYIRYWN